MNQEKTVEELVYELGGDSLGIFFIPGFLRHLAASTFYVGIEEKYDAFKRKASKLGVELPDFPEEPNDAFFEDQFRKVVEYIKINKTDSMLQLLLVGETAEKFLFSLEMVKAIPTYEDPEQDDGLRMLCPLPNHILPELTQKARDLLGVDLGELGKELEFICEKYKTGRFEQDFNVDNIRIRLKRKLCGFTSKTSSPLLQRDPSSAVFKRSEIDPTRVITDDCWAISLVRLPDSSNAEHAFLVLEGKTGTKSKIWFADFVTQRWFDVALPGTEDGKIRMEYHEAEGDPTTKLLFKCKKELMEVRATDRLLYSTWLIDKTTAEMLITMIKEKQKQPPKYHVLGNKSVVAKGSAMLSRNPTGHNSFTFAKMMLRDLNDPYIQLPEDDLVDWIVSASSRYLVNNRSVITDKELTYELGNDAEVLFFHTTLKDVTDGSIQEKYHAFKKRALKLGVAVLPDLPEEEPSQDFLNAQIIKVHNYIKRNKTDSMVQLFLVGSTAEKVLQNLIMAKILFEHETLEEGHKKKLESIAPLAKKYLQDLIKQAEELGVDLGDLEIELQEICENYKNLRFDQDFDEDNIRTKLKRKLCGFTSETSSPLLQRDPSSAVFKRSEIDPTRVITDECWAISLVRLPDSSNAEHAFLVLEGKTGGKSKIWFADFVAKHWVDLYYPGTEDGKIRVEYHEAEVDPTIKLLFKCKKELMKVRPGDRLLYSTWLIDKTTAEMLITMIEEKQKQPPKFHALGNKSVMALSSATSSSNLTGHNCFTFAKMMLRDLHDPYIQLPEDDLVDWIVSASRRYLVDKQEARRPWYKTSSFQLMLGFLVGVFVAFFLPKAFYPNEGR